MDLRARRGLGQIADDPDREPSHAGRFGYFWTKHVEWRRAGADISGCGGLEERGGGHCGILWKVRRQAAASFEKPTRGIAEASWLSPCGCEHRPHAEDCALPRRFLQIFVLRSLLGWRRKRR